MKDVIIPPIPTPFVDDQVSTEKLRFNLDRLNLTKISSTLCRDKRRDDADSKYLSR